MQILTGINREERKISSHKAVEITLLRSKKESRCCRGTREEFTDIFSGKIKWQDVKIINENHNKGSLKKLILGELMLEGQ